MKTAVRPLLLSDTGSNNVNVSMDEDTGEATTLFFTLQVTDRIHLALILRALWQGKLPLLVVAKTQH